MVVVNLRVIFACINGITLSSFLFSVVTGNCCCCWIVAVRKHFRLNCSMKTLSFELFDGSTILFFKIYCNSHLYCLTIISDMHQHCHEFQSVMITFKPYERYRPIRLLSRRVHEMCWQESQQVIYVLKS